MESYRQPLGCPAMDIAVNLVENYLRLTGYLTLSEFEVQRRDKKGRFKTVTDIDVMAMRLPGDVYLGDPHTERDGELVALKFVKDEPEAGPNLSSDAMSPTKIAPRMEAAEKEVFSHQADAPACVDCGSIMVRNGACYKCGNCGTTSGCS